MNALSSLSKHQFVKRIIGILIICIFLWNTSPATAELINYQASAGGYVVYDNVAQTYWMPLRNFAEMNMLGIANTISSYNNTFYYGISNWHLSTYNEFFQLTNHQSTQRAGEIASHFDMTRSELVEASLDVGDLIVKTPFSAPSVIGKPYRFLSQLKISVESSMTKAFSQNREHT